MPHELSFIDLALNAARPSWVARYTYHITQHLPNNSATGIPNRSLVDLYHQFIVRFTQFGGSSLVQSRNGLAELEEQPVHEL